MRALVAGAMCALALGCASAGPTSRPGGLRDVAQTENGTFIRTTPELSVTDEIGLPIDEAFAQMVLAYSKLGIQTTTMDANAHVVGNTAFSVQRRFHGEDLSKYFECGRDVTGFPRADHFRITFSAISTLRATGKADTEVETLVTAHGQDLDANSTDLHCSTTGHLEALLHHAAS